jgi:iron complex transport system ATP-binding protein
MKTSAHLLAVESARYAYGRHEVIRGLTLAVGAGEMLAVAGPNGAGKSTLLGLLSGIRRPTAGRVALLGRDLASYRRREVARLIAVVPQETAVTFPFTVAEMVLMGRAPHLSGLGIEGAHDREVAERAMARTGVLPLAGRLLSELSGGERQRVVLARALAQEPRVLLLDEPTTHLDLRHAIDILELIRALNRDDGLTVVAVLHDLTMAAAYFRRMTLLKDGAVQVDGPPRAVLDEAILARVFEVQVRVATDADGALVVRPRAPDTEVVEESNPRT